MSVKEIARLAHTSPATVSRILNNPEYHSQNPQLRDQVWKAAMELNYVPNEAARSLRSGNFGKEEKTYYINVLLTRTEDARSDPFFSELLRIIETEVHRSGSILHKVWYISAFSNERQCRMMNIDTMINDLYESTEKRHNGLIIVGKCCKSALTKLNNKFKNVVSINRNATNHLVDEVTCDGSKIASIAVEYLISLGHHEIGYVGECHNEARYKGYMETMTRHDIEPPVNYIYESRQTESDGYEVMTKILASDDIPTGIYCANDIMALGMLKALAKRKNKYLNIAIVSSDDIVQAQDCTPMLTTVSLPKEEMGKFAVMLLIDRINTGHKSVITMEFEAKLMKRESAMSLYDMGMDYSI
jgi:DNA-binding LacI/PurR family transcriptional regulator